MLLQGDLLLGHEVAGVAFDDMHGFGLDGKDCDFLARLGFRAGKQSKPKEVKLLLDKLCQQFHLVSPHFYPIILEVSIEHVREDCL